MQINLKNVIKHLINKIFCIIKITLCNFLYLVPPKTVGKPSVNAGKIPSQENTEGDLIASQEENQAQVQSNEEVVNMQS